MMKMFLKSWTATKLERAPGQILLLGIYSVFTLGLLNAFVIIPVSATVILEALLPLYVILTLLAIPKIQAHASALGLASLFYLCSSYLLAVNTGKVHYLDFFQAFKAFYYVFLLSLICNKITFTPSQIDRLCKFLVSVFIARYSFERLILGIDRPTVLVENNFELIFVLLVFFIRNISTKTFSLPLTIALILVFLLSGSRSSALALVLITLFSAPATRAGSYFNLINRKTIVAILSSLAGLMVAYLVFSSRLSDRGLEGIDRYRFFMFFLEETKDWSWYDFLFGAPVITKLSSATCSALNFYQNLFSFEGDGSCYSVILHSYILRVIFDHGLFGLAFLSYFLFSIFRFNLGRIHSFAILGVIMITALSVSSINSVYVALGIAISLATCTPYFSKDRIEPEYEKTAFIEKNL